MTTRLTATTQIISARSKAEARTTARRMYPDAAYVTVVFMARIPSNPAYHNYRVTVRRPAV